MLITRPQGRHQAGHVSASLHAPEPLDGFEDTGRHPPQHHLSAPPLLHLPLHVAGATQYTLGGVGRGERTLESP